MLNLGGKTTRRESKDEEEVDHCLTFFPLLFLSAPPFEKERKNWLGSF